MPRIPRIEFDNAWYHVMNRGAARQIIYPTEEYKHEFLRILDEVATDYRLEVHSYCLMPNHFHLLLKTPDGNLNLAMQKLTSLYARRHNKLARRDGPLFKGRYKSILVADERYLAQVSRYIHRNPVEANIAERAGDYSWSSMKYFVGQLPKPLWIRTESLVNLVSPLRSVQQYVDFVDNPRLPSMSDFYYSKRLPGVLGNKAARRLVENEVGYRDTWYPPERPSLDEITLTVGEVFGVSKEMLFSQRQGIANMPKVTAYHLSGSVWKYRSREVADYFGVTQSSVTQALVGYRKRELIKKSTQEKVEMITSKLMVT